MYQLLNKSLIPTNQMVKNLIMIEDAYINTYHPDFMGGANAIYNVFDPQAYHAQQAKIEKFEQDRLNFEEISDTSSRSSKSKPAKSQPKNQGGLFSSWYGGKNNDQEDSDDESAAVQELEMAKYRNDQDFEINKYI